MLLEWYFKLHCGSREDEPAADSCYFELNANVRFDLAMRNFACDEIGTPLHDMWRFEAVFWLSSARAFGGWLFDMGQEFILK
jgi:hypothetical protein